MQFLTSTLDRFSEVKAPLQPPDWCRMYTTKPQGNKSLYELEAMVAKRMELLAWIDQLVNSPAVTTFESILIEIGTWLSGEGRSQTSHENKIPFIDLGSDVRQRGRVQNVAVVLPINTDRIVHFGDGEDLISHLLCRFAFCINEKWKKWFLTNEEILLRARLLLSASKDPSGSFMVELMKKNGLECEALGKEQLESILFNDYLKYRKEKGGYLSDNSDHFYSVPMALATRLIKSRRVLLWRGKAILYRDQVQEVFLTSFRGHLNRGLHGAFLSRFKQQKLSEQTTNGNVLEMLDVFLENFVADPAESLKESGDGSVHAGDISRLAQTHFPLCMRQMDAHLRREGHLRHHGRFSYGLFLKAIGLSLEDSLQLFSSLMTVKGGGTLESFSKTAYGYSVRHNYGMEGKKTSYTSASCTTLLNLPPCVDKNDCHGCPFRYKDEAQFRMTLKKCQSDPRGESYNDVSLSVSDIEEIIADCKGQHYTRACFKYYMGTHPGAKRDTLFRSPYEYFLTSRELDESVTSVSSLPSKRSSEASLFNERVIKSKLE